jgi:hypothetical protein
LVEPQHGGRLAHAGAGLPPAGPAKGRPMSNRGPPPGPVSALDLIPRTSSVASSCP